MFKFKTSLQTRIRQYNSNTYRYIISVAASRGAWGISLPQSAPTCPPQKKKMVKISHFLQIFGFLPPQKRILPPRCPPQKKSGAATILRSFETGLRETVGLRPIARPLPCGPDFHRTLTYSLGKTNEKGDPCLLSDFSRFSQTM